jgi:hypothetical protein
VDHEWDWDRDEIVDLDGGACDVTGNPVEDITGYQSPLRRGQNLTGFTSTQGDWFSRTDEMREERQRRRAAMQANLDATRQRREQRRHQAQQVRKNSAGVSPQAATAAPPQPAPVEPTSADRRESQPGQHGAYFELRVTRPWYAPWRKRTTWTQVSAWTHGHVPTAGEVVTVSDLSEVPGKVHSFGTVDATGRVLY